MVLAVAHPWASASFDLSSQSLADVSGEFYVELPEGTDETWPRDFS